MCDMAFNPRYSLPGEEVISRSEDSVSVRLSIPSECSFFDGHFPEFKLLPAVGQFGIVTHLAQKYFGAGDFVSSIKRMKFSLPILPDSSVQVDLSYNRAKKEVSFSISDAADSLRLYASGKFA